jgi:Zn-dependent protease
MGMALARDQGCREWSNLSPMPGLRQGSLHLFRFSGIDVFLHWSWFVIAVFEIGARQGRYSSYAWSALEYLAIFVIVLLHEFGHAFACRSVGGKANRIMLWPLGGVAYVDAPQRPGAQLWSLAAGPLVNVALAPIFGAAFLAAVSLGWKQSQPDLYQLAYGVLAIDIVLLVFNLLPIYPLDGGQIVRSLLWYFVGKARSLQVATIIGFVGAAGLVGLAIVWHSTWTFLIAGFVLLNCWGGLQHARQLIKIEKLPRREGFACPECHTKPPIGSYWRCSNCNSAFDTFACQAACPFCGKEFNTTTCLDCGRSSPVAAWSKPSQGVLNGVEIIPPGSTTYGGQ